MYVQTSLPAAPMMQSSVSGGDALPETTGIEAAAAGAAPPAEAGQVVGAAPSDERWHDVAAKMSASSGHLGLAHLLALEGCPGGPGLDGLRDGLAFMHAVQLGMDALEAALVVAMDILGERARPGEGGRIELVRRAARSVGPGRPGLLARAMLPDLIELVRFREAAARPDHQLGPDAFAAAAVQAATVARALSARWSAISLAAGGQG
jgi:hypothetical protein